LELLKKMGFKKIVQIYMKIKYTKELEKYMVENEGNYTPILK